MIISPAWAPFTHQHPSANPDLMWIIRTQPNVPRVAIFNLHLSHDSTEALASIQALLVEGSTLAHQRMLIMGMTDANTQLFSPARPGRGEVKTALLFAFNHLSIQPIAPPTPDSFTRSQLVEGRLQKSFIDYICVPRGTIPCLRIELSHTFVDPVTSSFLGRRKTPSDHHLCFCSLPSDCNFNAHWTLRFNYHRLQEHSFRLKYTNKVLSACTLLRAKQPSQHTPETITQLHIDILEIIAACLQSTVGQRKVNTAPKANTSLLREMTAVREATYSSVDFNSLRDKIATLRITTNFNPNINTNPKHFWQDLNRFLRPKSLHPGPSFNDFHSHGQNKFGPRSFPLLQPQWINNNTWSEIVNSTQSHWNDVERSLAEILRAGFSEAPTIQLSAVKKSLESASIKTPGPSGLQGECIRAAANALAPIVLYLVTLCIQLGFIPANLISSYVIWLLKNGKPHEAASSYRPITLICILGKCIEEILGIILKKNFEETFHVPTLPSIPSTPSTPSISPVPFTSPTPSISSTLSIPSIPSIPFTPPIPSIQSLRPFPPTPSAPITHITPSIPTTPNTSTIPLKPIHITSHEQFAGKKGYGTEMFTFILRMLVESRTTPLFFAFLDLEGAFDKMWNPAVWHHLRSKGIKDSILRCLAKLYSHRPTQTKVQQTLSEIWAILDGTPQGSPNGTDLFCIFINTLISDLRNLSQTPGVGAEAVLILIISLVFVDDVLGVATSALALEQILLVAWKWSLKNKVLFGFGTAKTEFLIVDGRLPTDSLPSFSFNLGSSPLPQVATRKILTCVLSCDGKWHEHAKFWCGAAKGELRKLQETRFFNPNISISTSLQVVNSKVLSILNTDRGALFPHGYGSQQTEWIYAYQAVETQIQLSVLRIPAIINPPLPGVRGELGAWTSEGTSDFLLLKFFFRLQAARPDSLHGRVFAQVQANRVKPKPRNLAALLNKIFDKYQIRTQALHYKNTWNNHIRFKIHQKELELWRAAISRLPSLSPHLQHTRLETRPYLTFPFLTGRNLITQCRLRTLPLFSRTSTRATSSSCPLCHLEEETLVHFILRCPCQGMKDARSAFANSALDEGVELPPGEVEHLNLILMFTNRPIPTPFIAAVGCLLQKLWNLRTDALRVLGIPCLRLE